MNIADLRPGMKVVWITEYTDRATGQRIKHLATVLKVMEKQVRIYYRLPGGTYQRRVYPRNLEALETTHHVKL